MKSKIRLILKRIKYKFIGFQIYCKYKKYNRKDCVFLLCTPLHGNVGDQAIAEAESEFFQNLFPQKKVIEIPAKYINDSIKLWSKLVGDANVYVHGGGFIGTLWPEENYRFKLVITTFRNNNIIVLPQSIYFNEIEEKDILLMNKLFNTCKNIKIFAREKYSYKLINKYFTNSINYLVPDIVLYSKRLKSHKVRRSKKIIFCCRSDVEKTANFSNNIISDFINRNRLFEFRIEYTDTVIKDDIPREKRYEAIVDKIDEFAGAELVVTDRLHGMILSVLAGTAVIALDNQSRKVSGQFEWIKESENVLFTNDLRNVNKVSELIENKKIYDNSNMDKYFFPLIRTVMESEQTM